MLFDSARQILKDVHEIQEFLRSYAKPNYFGADSDVEKLRWTTLLLGVTLSFILCAEMFVYNTCTIGWSPRVLTEGVFSLCDW